MTKDLRYKFFLTSYQHLFQPDGSLFTLNGSSCFDLDLMTDTILDSPLDSPLDTLLDTPLDSRL